MRRYINGDVFWGVGEVGEVGVEKNRIMNRAVLAADNWTQVSHNIIYHSCLTELWELVKEILLHS